jgi:hypothetical protein
MSRSLLCREPRLSERELATVLAALRHWQQAVPEKDAHAYSPLHFASVQPLSRSEIDTLCERLNSGDAIDHFRDAIDQIRSILWRTADEWNPDNEWDSETVESVAGALEDLGLKPR